nr:immunoglobulin light chain junction region [Homo sapiens]MBB1718521.1 immunoglobulin light chain junction region [Homo sapiens]MBB1726604.1 immunoglobulin light chain junction region [Homo sapiens]MBB1737592.1 immunoglobulin light chain junction region [Homo sapiens]
CQKYSSSSITF